MTNAIELSHLRKVFPVQGFKKKSMVAIDDISLAVGEGEVFGFIGPNGAGKSTTIKIITGVMQATSGIAKLFDVPVSDPAARMRLGYVPENPYLSDYLSPLEILVMGLRLHKLALPNENRHCMEWLERFQLAEVAHKAIRTFSKGMTQRTALAQAMCIQPRLLILDEPLSGLDPVGRKEVVDILSTYQKNGGTIFLTSHVLHDVERLADRFGLIHHGKLITIRSPQEIVADQADHFVLRYRGDRAIGDSVLVRTGLYARETKTNELAWVISEILAGGGVIQDVLPKVSLETVFFRTITDSTLSEPKAPTSVLL